MRERSIERYLESACFRAIVIATLVIVAALFASSPNGHGSQAASDKQPEHRADQQKDAESFWERTTHDPIAAYTGALAVFSGALVLVSAVQIYFLNRSDKTARLTAEAAKRSADAFAIAERPYIFIWGVTGTIPVTLFTVSRVAKITAVPPITQNDEILFYYTVSNRGKLTAIIEKVSIGCGHERNGYYPPMIIIGDHIFTAAPLISVGEDIQNLMYRAPLQRLNLPRPIPELQDGLIFRVLVAYRGPFTKGHETSQCWRFNSSIGGFAEVTDENYTYIR